MKVFIEINFFECALTNYCNLAVFDIGISCKRAALERKEKIHKKLLQYDLKFVLGLTNL